MFTKKSHLFYFILVFVLTLGSHSGFAQSILDKSISLDVRNQRLDHVLEILSNKGGFYFSYNSSIIRRDSLVSVSANNRSVKEILDQIFTDNYEFRISGNYIIIRKAPIKLTLVTNKAMTDDKIYVVSGYILDDKTGEQIHNASIYEKRLLASTLSNEEGYFKLKLKSKSKTAALTVSKELYEDTTVMIEPKYNQQITITIVPVENSVGMITISPEDYFVPDSLKVRVVTETGVEEYTYKRVDSMKVEKTSIGRFFLSSKQKIQTLNVKKFFTERPYQVSLTPGLSSHGKLSPQVINHFSLNVFGGYTGGTNGLEIGGLFNIDKKYVQYAQFAGLFNVVGGHVRGMQVAGLSNTVLDSVKGFQVAGIKNMVKGKFTGMQVGGVYNHVSDSVKGFQVAGVGNFVKEKVVGTQIAGVGNVAAKTVDGTQIAGVFNYAKKLKGVQIGLINIADSSEGYSIGLINVIFKGYHKLTFSTNELLNVNASFKTGNYKLYSILYAGMNAKEREQAYSFGYGLGKEFRLGKTFSINPELSSQYLYLGSWDYFNLVNRANLNFTVKLGKYVSLFAGPSFSVYHTNQDVGFADYLYPIPKSAKTTYEFSSRTRGWLGWNAGISFF